VLHIGLLRAARRCGYRSLSNCSQRQREQECEAAKVFHGLYSIPRERICSIRICRWRNLFGWLRLLLAWLVIVMEYPGQSLISERRRNESQRQHDQRNQRQRAALAIERRSQRHIRMPSAGKAQHYGPQQP